MPSIINFREIFLPDSTPYDKYEYMNFYPYNPPSCDIRSQVLYTLADTKGLYVFHILEEVLGVDLLSDEMIYLLYKNLRGHQQLHQIDNPWRNF